MSMIVIHADFEKEKDKHLTVKFLSNQNSSVTRNLRHGVLDDTP